MTSTSTDATPDDRARWPAEPGPRLERLVHDLRTPLTIVTGFSDLLERRNDLTEAQRTEFVGRIAEAGRELGAILDSERADRRS
jgi:signal transduction histidine kinase